MGEIAEDMIDGTVCQTCGCFMQDVIDCAEKGDIWDAPGYPRTCEACKD
jgi:hypothetical protein